MSSPHRLYFFLRRFMFTLVYSTRRSQGCMLSALPRTEINCRDAGRVACAYNRYRCRGDIHAQCQTRRAGVRALPPKRPVTFASLRTLYSRAAFGWSDAFCITLTRRWKASTKEYSEDANKRKEIFECRSSTFCASNDTCRFFIIFIHFSAFSHEVMCLRMFCFCTKAITFALTFVLKLLNLVTLYCLHFIQVTDNFITKTWNNDNN